MKPYNHISISLTSLLLLSSMTGCYDDKGNYDYVDLDEVVISTEGTDIKEAYAIDRYDQLTIAPKVYYNGKEVVNDTDAPLTYLWTMYSVATGSGVDYTIDTLSTSRILDKEIARVSGSYYIQLTVTKQTDGIETYFRTTCNVEESITAGWMLLYERADKPGTSDVGLVVNPLVKKIS